MSKKLTKEQVSVIHMYFSENWKNLTMEDMEKNVSKLTGKPYSVYYEHNEKDYFNVDFDIVLFRFLEQYPFTKLKSTILEKLYDSNSLELVWFNEYKPSEDTFNYEELLERSFRKD
jgi:hypothetical protein